MQYIYNTPIAQNATTTKIVFINIVTLKFENFVCGDASHCTPFIDTKYGNADMIHIYIYSVIYVCLHKSYLYCVAMFV